MAHSTNGERSQLTVREPWCAGLMRRRTMGAGVDPAITGEPPEERALPRGASVEPDGTRPVTAVDERSRASARRERAASEVVPRCRPAGRRASSSSRVEAGSAERPLSSAPAEHRDVPEGRPRAHGHRRPVDPAVPRRSRSGSLRYWDEDGTFVASVEQRPAGDGRQQRVRLLRRAAVRQRPAALRPPAHRLRQGRRARATRRCAAAGSSAASAGTATACPPRWRPRRSSASRSKARDRRPRASRVQRRLPHLGAASTPRTGSEYVNRQARWVDFEQRLQDPRPRLHGERHVGLQDAVGQGPGLRGLPRAGLLLALRDAAVQHRDPDGRRLPRPPGPGAHRLVRAGRPASRAARSGRRTPWTLPTNLALAVGPDIDYACGRTGSRGERFVLARGPARRTTPRELGGLDQQVGTVQGRRAGRAAATRRCSPSSPSRPARTPSRCSAATSSPPRTAPASSTSPRPSARTTRTSATPPASRPVVTGRRPRPVHRARSRRTQGEHVFEANKPIIRDLKAAPGVRVRHDTYDHSYPHCWRCDKPLVYKAVSSLVREGHAVPGPHGRAEPGDHLGARARQGRLVRQVARQRPRLVDQPQPLLGLADPGVEVRRPGLPAGRRLRLARRARARLRRAPERPAPPVRRRADAAQPGRPDRPSRRCAACPEVLDCWFESGSMPFAQVHYPFENADWFEHHYPGDFIVEYIGQTRGWFYTHARAGDRAVRPAGVPQLRQPRHRARRRRPEDVQEPAQLPGRAARCSTRTAPTRCAGS